MMNGVGFRCGTVSTFSVDFETGTGFRCDTLSTFIVESETSNGFRLQFPVLTYSWHTRRLVLTSGTVIVYM